MVNWKQKEPGYYTMEGEIIFNWRQLLKKRMIVFMDGDDSILQYVRIINPMWGVLVLDETITCVAVEAFSPAFIKGVVLNEGLEEIWDRAFLNRRQLEFVIFPSTIKRIGRSAFRNCYSLKEVEINSVNLNEIGGLAFAYTDLRKVNIIAQNLIYLDEQIFKCCNEMHTCNIDAPIAEIGNRVFEHCYALKNYKSLSSITYLNWGSLAGCPEFEKLINIKYKKYFSENPEKKGTDEAYNSKNLINVLLHY